MGNRKKMHTYNTFLPQMKYGIATNYYFLAIMLHLYRLCIKLLLIGDIPKDKIKTFDVILPLLLQIYYRMVMKTIL